MTFVSIVEKTLMVVEIALGLIVIIALKPEGRKRFSGVQG